MPAISSFAENPSGGQANERQPLDRWLKVLAILSYCAFAVWLTIRNRPWLAGDSVRYLDLSAAILQGKFGLMHHGVYDPEAWRGPGYPAFLALASVILAKSALAIIILQHALALSSIFLMYLAVRKEISLPAARVFLVLCSLYPFIAEATAKFLTEPLCLFLISVSIYTISQRREWSPWAAGICGAMAGLVRPNLMLLPLLYCLAYLFAKRDLRKAIIVCVVAAAALLPWSIRNYEVFGRFSPMPPGGGPGAALLLAAWETHVSADSLFQWVAVGKITPELQNSGILQFQESVDARLNVPTDRVCLMMDSFETSDKMIAVDSILRAEGLRLIREAPGRYFLRTLWNVPRMWFSAATESRMAAVKRYPMIALGLCMWIASAAGFLLLMRKAILSGSEALFVLWLMPVYFTLTLCWFQHDARYTIPGRLTLIALASYAIASVLGQLYGRATMKSVGQGT